MISATTCRSGELAVNALNWFFSRTIVDWKKYSYIIETISSFIPLYTRTYVLYDAKIVRCKCCGGILTVSVSGNRVTSACLHKEVNKDKTCENYIDGKCKFKTCRGTEQDKFSDVDLRNQRKLVYFKAMTILNVISKKKHCEYVDLYDFKDVIDILSGFGMFVFTNPDWHHPRAIISGPEARRTKKTKHYQFYNRFGMRNADHPWIPLFCKIMENTAVYRVVSDPLPSFIGRLFER